jgi:DNA repair exonuclease SbcCD nuclease subunit
MKILVCSDWHSDASTAGLPRFDDVKAAIDKIVEAAVDNKVKLFLFLGDLCDPDSVRSHRAIAHSIDVAAELWMEHDIPSRWLTGNHDVLEDGSGDHTLMAMKSTAKTVNAVDGSFNERIAVYDAPRWEDFRDFALVALPFTARKYAYSPVEYIKSVATTHDSVVIVGHLNIEGIGPGSEVTDMPRGRDVFFPVAACMEKWNHPILLNGHIHKAQKFGDIWIPGSPVRLTFGEESNSPGYLIVEV